MAGNISDTEAQNGTDFLVAVGNVITSWQGVEYAICEIFLAFYPSTYRDVPSITYHSIRTIEARITVVTALITRFCNKQQKSAWNKLRDKIKKRKVVRNATAHGMSTLLGASPNRVWGIGHSPYDLDNFSGSNMANSYYTQKELEEAGDEIIVLTKNLDAFREELESDVVLQANLLLQQRCATENNNKALVVALSRQKPETENDNS